uniref:Uncharacterized protein n=1 Tax=viral metagenome TaxID=1070528 RepID=A0A6C0LW58_9ZZZZ
MAEFSPTAIVIIVVAVILAILAAGVWVWIIRDRIKERRSRMPDIAMSTGFAGTIPYPSRRSSVASNAAPKYSVHGNASNPYVTNRYSSGYYNILGTVARDQTT